MSQPLPDRFPTFSTACLSLFESLFVPPSPSWWRVVEKPAGRYALEAPSGQDAGRPPVEIVAAHVGGGEQVALSPLAPDGTVRFMVFALGAMFGATSAARARPWRTDVVELSRAAMRLGVPLYTELLRSEHGIHAWVFFSEPVPATDARRLGSALLLEVKSAVGEEAPLSFDRIYPVETLPGGEGTAGGIPPDVVPLPLHGPSRARGLTIFVQASRGLHPVRDQWALLALVQRMSVADVQGVLARVLERPEARSLAAGRVVSAPRPFVLSGSLALPRPISRHAMGHLRQCLAGRGRGGEAESALRRLRRFRDVLRRRDGDSGLVQTRASGWLLPRGVSDGLQKWFQRMGLPLDLVDARCHFEPLPLAVPMLESREKKSLDPLLRADCGRAILPDPLWRSRVALAAVALRGVPALVVSSHRVEQWREEARLWLGLEETSPALVVASYRDVLEKCEEGWENRFGLLVLDEADRVPADQLAGVIRALPAAFVLGLQEAPRDDGLEPLLDLFVGPVLYRAAPPRAPLVDVVVQPTRFAWTPDDGLRPPARHRAMLKAVSLDAARNELVAGRIAREAVEGRSCLVFAFSREHARTLADLASHQGVVVEALTGDTPQAERGRIVRDFQEGRTRGLVVIEPRFGVTFDCPHLASVFLALPVAASPLRQCLAPLLRASNLVPQPRVFDFVDVQVEELAAMASGRREVYRREHTTLNPETFQMELPFGEEDTDADHGPPADDSDQDGNPSTA